MSKENQIFLPNVKTGAHIGILGGSFDPPHICHQLFALSFLALENIDALWVIPCADHAFKRVLSDFQSRFAMCKIAFQRINHIQIVDIESKLKAPNYTIQTINFILEHRPDLELSLGIGSDLVLDFCRWHQAEEVAKKSNLVIFERQSYPIVTLPEILKTARIHRGHSLPDINSTALRDDLRNNKKDKAYPFLDRDVATYIDSHNLYSN